MDIIQLLPDTVANQIAAGEVIQRPASVIKELVENAVDAGARTIHVLVVEAGRSSIQVIDDGKGMSETDARLAFERHATSKIRQADDLFSLHTMGFRGEALPSIAAVSQVELTTRMASEEVGVRLNIAASKLKSQEPVSCPVGSNFLVENLFYNVPARRRFLKSNATELNNILSAFERIVLVYPEVMFTLHSNGNELLNLREGTLMQRITDVFGKRFSQDLMPVDVKTAMGDIHGFVGKPEAAKKKGTHQYFFVNGRYMKHPYFHKAVVSAFERLIPEGTQPPYFLYFEVPPADIDVNIHPTKTEIKFENEQSIWQILMATVKDAIGRFCEVPSIDFDTTGRPEIPAFVPSRDRIEAPRVNYDRAYNPFKSSRGNGDHPLPEMPEMMVRPEFLEMSELLTDGNQRGETDGPDLSDAPALPDTPSLFEENFSQTSPLADPSPAHYQYKGRYIMTAVKSGLMIVDQHRASVRVLYEKYLSRTVDHPMVSQRVLFPEVVQFSPSEQALLSEILPQLPALGFDLADLGGGSYAINAIPAGIDGDPGMLVRNIVADAGGQGETTTGHPQEKLALSLARATAVPYGQVLNNEEMDNLTNQLFACRNVNYTPDGYAILAILPQTAIDRLLG